MEENSNAEEAFRVNNLLSYYLGGSGKIQKVGIFHSFPIKKVTDFLF